MVKSSFRRCFQEADTRNDFIGYKTGPVPELAAPVVSYQIPHKLHHFLTTTSEVMFIISYFDLSLTKKFSAKTLKNTGNFVLFDLSILFLRMRIVSERTKFRQIEN